MFERPFICYSRIDGQELADRIYDGLPKQNGEFNPWMDRRDLVFSISWRKQIQDAIKKCSALVFVVTDDSAQSDYCSQEWSYALSCKKPIVPVTIDSEVVPPLGIADLHSIDCQDRFDDALANLGRFLRWLPSPPGMLYQFETRLREAKRSLHHASDNPGKQKRIEDEIVALKAQILRQQEIVDNPEDAAQRTRGSIKRGLEREQESWPSTASDRIVNPAPGSTPDYFQDRQVETDVLLRLLSDSSVRMVSVIGRAGIGKTALVCKVLHQLEHAVLFPDSSLPRIFGIVYLSAAGSRNLSFSNIYTDLVKLLPAGINHRLLSIQADPGLIAGSKMRLLLEQFRGEPALILLDNFEDAVSVTARTVEDAELKAALEAILEADQHSVKVLLTSRIAPIDIAFVQPTRQRQINLEKGLPSPHAENVLRELDADGSLGLRDASDSLLNEARERTRGHPRALESLFGILIADRDTTLPEILNSTTSVLPDNVVDSLVGEAFSRLDSQAQQVICALAIFGRPVPPVGVDYLLEPVVSAVDSAPVLSRLVSMHFVRKEDRRYYLHPIDRAYALDRLADSKVLTYASDEVRRFDRNALLRRAADYYCAIAKPESEWSTLEDLAAPLAEFDLRYQAGDYEDSAVIARRASLGFLYVWGQFNVMAEINAKLLERVKKPYNRYTTLRDYAYASRLLGHLEAATNTAQCALEVVRREFPAIEGTALNDLGGCLHDIGNTAQAIECFEESIEVDFEARELSSSAVSNLSLCYGELGHFDDALEFAQIAREILEREQSRLNLGLHCQNLSTALIDTSNLDKATECSLEGIRLGAVLQSPMVSAYCYETLVLAMLLAGDVDEAWFHSEKGKKFELAEVDHRRSVYRGIAAWLKGDLQAAMTSYERAIQQSKGLLQQRRPMRGTLDSLGLALLGLTLCGQVERKAEAVAAFQSARAANANPGDISRVKQLLHCLQHNGGVDIPVEIRKAALRLPEGTSAPTLPASLLRRYRLMANIKLRLCGPQAAAQSLEQAIQEQERTGGGTSLERSGLFELLGSLYEQQDEVEAALRAYENALAALEQDPGEAGGHYVVLLKYLASEYHNLDRTADAKRLYRRGLKRYPEHSNLLGVYAFFLFSTESEDPAQSILLFEKSIALGDRDSNILANYALVQVTLGERDAAEGLLNRALKEGISTPPRSIAKVMFLWAAVALIDEKDPTTYFRYLKSVLSGELVDIDWPINDFFVRIRDLVLTTDLDFLRLLAEAISRADKREALKKLSRWSTLIPLPVEDYLDLGSSRAN